MPKFLPSKAMIFAAGLGTRMRPLTDFAPKALVSVAGKTLLDHTLDRFAAMGVETAIVNVHHCAEQIESHLTGRKAPRILISDERDRLLDQGGGIAKALPWLGSEPFFLANTDAFWIEGPIDNLSSLVAAWQPEIMDVLLLVAATTRSIGIDSAGDFHMAADGRLTRRAEREIAPFVYTGIGIIKPELFSGETREVFPLAPFFYNAAQRGRLHGRRLDGFWFHVGTPEAVAEAERKLLAGVL